MFPSFPICPMFFCFSFLALCRDFVLFLYAACRIFVHSNPLYMSRVFFFSTFVEAMTISLHTNTYTDCMCFRDDATIFPQSRMAFFFYFPNRSSRRVLSLHFFCPCVCALSSYFFLTQLNGRYRHSSRHAELACLTVSCNYALQSI